MFMNANVTVTKKVIANAKAAPVPDCFGEMSSKHSQVVVVGMDCLESVLSSPFRYPTNTKIFAK